MTPIAPLITAFLREYMPIERGYSPHTCETYAHACKNRGKPAPDFGRKRQVISAESGT